MEEAQKDNSKSNNEKKETTNKTFMLPATTVLAFLVFTIAVAVILEIVPHLRKYVQINNTTIQQNPTYAIYGKSKHEDHLKHVINVLERFGYSRVELSADWNLLWAHDYPFFDMQPRLKNLKPSQLVNHVPGCGFISNKVDLCTSKLSFMPAAFRLPKQREEFLHYAKLHSDALFVQKHNEHRHIIIRAPQTINLDANDSFVQEFVHKPFLVDGYKFDLGVYVLITSIDPLMMYLYKGDVLFRYCTETYYPFDTENVKKYVVDDNYLPTWQVPSLRKYFLTLGSNMRDAFDAYVRDQQKEPAFIWRQVEHIVRETVLAKHEDISRVLRGYKQRNFFELLRFDLIVDEDLRVHLMEANMSPNLSSAHFKPNSLLYEQILYSVLQIVGVGSPVRNL